MFFYVVGADTTPCVPPPPCVPPGGRLVLEASWELLSSLVQRVVKEARASGGQAGCLDLGGGCTFTVAEALVLEAMFGPSVQCFSSEIVRRPKEGTNKPEASSKAEAR